jgi:DNA-directed RNA polymerase subunit RPC12/RpoP
MEKRRFQDKSVYLSIFKNDIDVCCPKCKRHAKIINISDDENSKFRFTCSHCGYSKTPDKNTWFGPIDGIIYRRCGKCGVNVHKIIPNSKRISHSHIVCESCGHKMFEKVEWHPRLNNQAIDPYFGASLWFKKSISSNTLWAYNLKHLEFLEEYVSADIRERVPNQNSSLASRLPSWIKNRKNRTNILKAINELKKESMNGS